MAKQPVEQDHISVHVRDLKRARIFYQRVIGAIGMKISLDVSSAFGMGSDGEKIFWLVRDRNAAARSARSGAKGRRAARENQGASQ